MAVPRLPGVEEGRNQTETIQNLFDAYVKLRREVEFLLNNLDSKNVKELDANVTRIKNLIVDTAYINTLIADYIEANTIVSNTIITNTLTAQKGYIAELTVDEIDTSDMVIRYLLPSTDPLRLAPIGYWRGRDQFIEFFDAQIPDPLDVDEIQVTGRTGAPLYWLDAESIGTGITETETAYPVMRFVYNGPDGIGFVKLSIFHRYDDETGYYNPLIKLGAGNGVGDNATATIEKQTDGLYLTYIATGAGSVAAGESVSIGLTNDGLILNGLTFLLDALNIASDSFQATYGEAIYNATLAKDVDGRITQINTGEKVIPVTYDEV